MIDPRKSSKLDAEGSRRQEDKESDGVDSEDDDPRLSSRKDGSKTGTVNTRNKNIRTGTVGREDDDSDFDL